MSAHKTTLPSLFGSTFVINLPERTDRRKLVEREFSTVGWNSVYFFPALRFDDAGGFKYPSWRGCFYSHLGCLRLAQESDCESVLILEDDIALCSSILALTPLIIEAVSGLNWDFLYFGHELTGNIARAKRKTESVKFDACDSDVLTAHFYAVNKRIISRLIAHLEKNAITVPHDGCYGPMPVDGAYNTFRRYNKDVITYLANPKLGWQRPSRSDITPSRLDSYRAIRPVVSQGRRIKYLLQRTLKGL